MRPLLAILFIWISSYSSIQAAELIPSDNLYQDAQLAQKANQPIAILLYSNRVNSGQKLKDEALVPNIMNGIYDGKVLFREVAVNEEGDIKDFYGEPLPKKELKDLFNVTSLPVVVFVDYEGNQLTTPLLSGAYDFYGFYLKRKLNEAMQALNNPARFD